MNLYHFYPTVFWNTACLSTSAAIAAQEEEEETKNIVPTYDEMEFLQEEEEEEETKKKKAYSTNYDKIAIAIGEIQSKGIEVALPDINKSIAEFTPDVERNKILYGLKGISNVSDGIINEIIENRPYIDLNDFLSKVKATKTVVINLIKAGCFDDIIDRVDLMKEYIIEISAPKKTLNLRNFQGLTKYSLLPTELDDCKYAFTMNKFLKANKTETHFLITDELFPYFENAYGSDLIEVIDNQAMIQQKNWDKNIYQVIMDKARVYIKSNLESLLEQYNQILYMEQWKKYCNGSISKWEMDSVSFYFNSHELQDIDYNAYGYKHFSELPETPTPIKFFKHYPIYDVCQIAGTVLGKNKIKSTVTILDADGSVVTIRFRKEFFNFYDKQISEKQEDGTKKVVEKSWFKRGNKIVVGGYRRENDFVPKVYSATPFKTLYNIIDVTEDNKLLLRSERVGE